ncbi:Ribosomal protein L34 [Penicillium fimorum]|uniref:Ribosomal protein L34 n=1 Tax=Penicillium fimorum TaxID=1882269 RepID=A0A9X0C4Z8_9EURO|nr:Ribosomal protein L34 [Penicillium fimorum]
MFCLRARAVPSTFRATTSAMRTPMNRFAQIPQQSSTPSTMLSYRSFSSLLSTPTRFQPSRTLGARLSSPITTATASAFSPLSSLRSQKAPSQSRSFSASASLGVRRVTFRPSRRVQKRRHGYLARKKDRNGRKTLIRRTLKGRKELSW